MKFSKDDPLSRIKGETIKAHNALMDYFLMGSGRSLNLLLEKYRAQIVSEVYLKAPPTKRLQTLKNWSSRYHWQARIARQAENDNAIILDQRRQALEKIEAEFRERHMGEAEALAILADHARGDMGQLAGVRAQTDLAKHPQSALVKTITQHYTQTTRGTGEAAQAEIKARIALGLYDAQRALELILKHHGSFEKDNKRQNLNVDVDISNLTVDQLKRLAAGEDIAAILADE
jgi:hypothetical protein